MQAAAGMSSTCVARLNKELRQLELEPPPGVSAWPRDGKINALEAVIQGPTGSPYAGGSFKLEILVPDRYPFEPPKIRFITPIYHPNIDSGGRICLDTLNMPPKGSWKPAVNLSTVLASVQQLIADPNPDDGLVPEITQEFKENRALYESTARSHTAKHAVDTQNATIRGNPEVASVHVPCSDNGNRVQGGGAHAADANEAEEASDADSEDSEDEEEDLQSLWGKPAGTVHASRTALLLEAADGQSNSRVPAQFQAAASHADHRGEENLPQNVPPETSGPGVGSSGRAAAQVAADVDASAQKVEKKRSVDEVDFISDSEEETNDDDLFRGTMGSLLGKRSAGAPAPVAAAAAASAGSSRPRY